MDLFPSCFPLPVEALVIHSDQLSMLYIIVASVLYNRARDMLIDSTVAQNWDFDDDEVLLAAAILSCRAHLGFYSPSESFAIVQGASWNQMISLPF